MATRAPIATAPLKLQRAIVADAPAEPIPDKIDVVDPPSRRLSVKRDFERAAWIRKHRQYLAQITLDALLSQYSATALDKIPAADMVAILYLLDRFDAECAIDLSKR